MFRIAFLFCGFFFAQVSSAQWIISDSLLKVHISALADDSMQGRLTGSAGAEKAAHYIAAQMEAIGLKKMAGREGGFLLPWKFSLSKNGDTAYDVAGVIPGKSRKDTLIIFSAHYDHIGTLSNQKAFAFGTTSKRVKGDNIFNGANDDASGVAAMLELARVFSTCEPEYTLLFIAFSGEEQGFLSSSNFVQKLNPKLVKQNINLEMLGRPAGKQPYITEDESSDFRKMLNANLFRVSPAYGKKYFTADPYPSQKLFERSDNFPFHQAGIPANTIMATDPFDRFYHSSADHTSTIDFEAMTEIVQAILLAIKPFILSE
jgi:Zn-dependent M28 family amino/carboxypeptidase